MDNQYFEASLFRSSYMRTMADLLTKEAAIGYEYIGEVPQMGGSFANRRLEEDYQMKHPVLSTMHPMTYGMAAVGATAAHLLGLHGVGGTVGGAVVGGTAGMMAEGLHRLNYLNEAKKKLEAGQDPTDQRYRL